MKKFNVALLLISTVILSACATKYDNLSKQNNQYDLSNMSAIAIVSQESQKALNAQQMLVRYRQQENAMLAVKQMDFDNDKIVIDYIGKPQSLLNSIAIKYGYRFLEVGHSTSLPTVNFNKYYTTPKNALALVDGQLNGLAKIHLNEQQKLITLTYQ